MPGTFTSKSDPYADAMIVEPSRFVGQVKIDAHYCALIKGSGRRLWDPSYEGVYKKHTAIDFQIVPLDSTHQVVERKIINWTVEFRQVVQPSVETLRPEIAKIRGKDDDNSFVVLRELNGLWVIGEYVPSPSNKEGDTWTTFNFTHVFATREECEAAFESASPQASTTLNAKDRATLADFLPSLWQQSGHDEAKFLKLIADNPLLASEFTVDSPEVTEAMAPFSTEQDSGIPF